jgi:hypothetical protein
MQRRLICIFSYRFLYPKPRILLLTCCLKMLLKIVNKRISDSDVNGANFILCSSVNSAFRLDLNIFTLRFLDFLDFNPDTIVEDLLLCFLRGDTIQLELIHKFFPPECVLTSQRYLT